jgi:hypothetical protein
MSNRVVAHPPDVRGAVPGDNGDRVDAAAAQRSNLPLEQRQAADRGETLVALSDHFPETIAPAGRENDRSHAPSETGRRGTRCRMSAATFER